jgi:hypothetical protein
MITEAFQKLKSKLELHPSFDQTIQQKHNAVRSALENIDPTIKTKLIGSLQRRTRIQPRQGHTFDIDILVIRGHFDRWAGPSESGFTAQQALDQLHGLVRSSPRYGSMGPQQDQPTVTFEYQNDVKVELVPGYIDMIGHSSNGTTHMPTGRGYWIPKDSAWELADYDYEASHVSALNQTSNGLLIPTVKMLKAIRRLHFPNLTGYHLEVIATHTLPTLFPIYQQRSIQPSFPGLITDFFNLAGNYLTQPLRMSGSNTPHLTLDPIQRVQTTRVFAQIREHCNTLAQMGTEAAQFDAWRTLFGDIFSS